MRNADEFNALADVMEDGNSAFFQEAADALREAAKLAADRDALAHEITITAVKGTQWNRYTHYAAVCSCGKWQSPAMSWRKAAVSAGEHHVKTKRREASDA